MRNKNLLCRLNILMADKGIRTITDLQKKTGLTRRTIDKLINNDATLMDLKTTAILCGFFNCEIDDLYQFVSDEEYGKVMEVKKKNEARRKNGHVYFLKDQNINLVKIGRTSQLDRRKRHLEQEYNTTLELIHCIETTNTIKLEKEVHRLYADYRFEGEWFRISEQDLDRLENL